MSLRIAQVVAVHPQYRTCELVFIDDGWRVADVPFAFDYVSSNSGRWSGSNVPRPPTELEAGGLHPEQDRRTVLAVVGFIEDRPVVLGFTAHPLSQMAFYEETQQNREIWRHPSGTIVTVSKTGALEVQHTGGMFLRIAYDEEGVEATQHEDLTPHCANENWELPANDPPTVTLANGAFRMVIRPNGDTEILSGGNGEVKFLGDVTAHIAGHLTARVQREVEVTSGADITVRTPTNCTVTAGGDAHLKAMHDCFVVAGHDATVSSRETAVVVGAQSTRIYSGGDLAIAAGGNIDIAAGGSISTVALGSASIATGGGIDLNTSGGVGISGLGGISASSPSDILMTTPAVVMNTPLLTVLGDIVSGGTWGAAVSVIANIATGIGNAVSGLLSLAGSRIAEAAEAALASVVRSEAAADTIRITREVVATIQPIAEEARDTAVETSDAAKGWGPPDNTGEA